MTRNSILITGGSGLVGTQITELLLAKGYSVSHLSRKEDFSGIVKKYKWDPSSKSIDIKAFENVDHIIHLAGAGIADKRWTDERKKEIIDSRVESTQLLFNTLKTNKNNVKSIVSASAIGYYGFSKVGSSFAENSEPGSDFLAGVTKDWEKEVDEFEKINIRVVKLRIGVVLTSKGGALPQMALPIKLFAGSPLGSGSQIVSWIDLVDLCNLFVFGIENENMNGAYNAVAPNPVSNKQLTKAIAKVLHRPVWPVNVPEFMLKIIIGEMQVVVTGSCNVENKRIKEETDFKYIYTDVEESLKHNLQ